MFDIYSKDKRESFRLLQNKIDEWDGTGAKILINNAEIGNQFYDALKIFEKHAIFAELTEEVWHDVLTTALVDRGGDTVRALLEDNKDLNIAEILNYLVAQDKKRKPFSTNSKSSLIDNLRITLDENGEIKIVSEQGKITPTL